MKFQILSTLVAISYCSLVSAAGSTRGLFSSSSTDAPSYNHTSSVDIAKEFVLFGTDNEIDDPGDRAPILSVSSVSAPNLCLQPARLQNGAGVELLPCIRNKNFKRRQGWVFTNNKLRHNMFHRMYYRDMCVTVQVERENILLHELIMGPCGGTKNTRTGFIYDRKTRHLRWKEDQRYYVTNLGTALYLRERIPMPGDNRGQRWVFSEGWAQKARFQDQTTDLHFLQPANDTKLPTN